MFSQACGAVQGLCHEVVEHAAEVQGRHSASSDGDASMCAGSGSAGHAQAHLVEGHWSRVSALSIGDTFAHMSAVRLLCVLVAGHFQPGLCQLLSCHTLCCKVAFICPGHGQMCCHVSQPGLGPVGSRQPQVITAVVVSISSHVVAPVTEHEYVSNK